VPRLAIVIVSFNAREDVLRCLATLHEPAPLVAHDIVVVDNQSSDGSAAAVRARWPRVRVIEAGRNVGFAAANNLGIRATNSELVLLLNPDTLVPAGAVDALVAVLDRQPDIAIAGPRLVDATGRPEPRLGRMRGPFSELAQKIVGRGRLPGTRGIVDRRPAGRGLLHVLGGRGPLRHDPPPWPRRALHAVGRSDAPRRPLRSDRIGPRGVCLSRGTAAVL
jgi:glycosyltransferase involved in cell wall biosynthesis